MLELVAFIMHADGPTHLRALKNQDRWAFRYDLKKKTTKYVLGQAIEPLWEICAKS